MSRGRPKSSIDLKDGWYNDVLKMYSEGASDVEIKAYIYEKRGGFSNDLWDRWLKEEPEFYNCITEGRKLSTGKEFIVSQKHKERLIKRKERRNSNKEYNKNKFAYSQRALLRHHLKKQGATKSKKTFELFGYSPDDLINNIKSKLKEGMTFDNYGLWHIDHIKPLSKFDLTNEYEIKKAWSFDNLQCLWALDNLRKSNRYNENTVIYAKH